MNNAIMPYEFTYINHPTLTGQHPTFNPLTSTFTLEGISPTDLYRTPSSDTFNGPILGTTIPLSSFQRMRTTVSAPWRTLYDQGGLVFVISPSKPDEEPIWIKGGIEFFNNQTNVGVVSANYYSDWSLVPYGEQSLTIEFERAETVLWVYMVTDDEKKEAVRELTWVFDDAEGKEVTVGTYTCKPTPKEGEGEERIEITFSGFELETVKAE